MSPHYLALFLAISISATGQLLLKAGAVGQGDFIVQLFRWQTVIGLGCYAGSALLYIAALREIPMSVALPSTALSYAVIASLGYLVWGEPVSVQRIAALALICTGVVMLTRA